MLAFDRRGNPPYPVVMIPFIPMQADHSQPVASCFDELSRHFGRPGV
jgi:hypothetical protein